MQGGAAPPDRGGRLPGQLARFIGTALLLGFCLALWSHADNSLQQRNYVTNIHIAGPFSVSLNCDSPAFIHDALHPGDLLMPDSHFRSRPGLIIAAAALSSLLSAADPLFERVGPTMIAPDTAACDTRDVLGKDSIRTYTAYFIIDIIILSLCFVTYWKIISNYLKISIIYNVILCVSLLFVLNDNSKMFLLSPHTQFFNILVPLVCTYLCVKGLTDERFEGREMFTWSFVGGLGILIYGTFVLLLPSMIAATTIRHWREGQTGRRWASLIIRFAGMSVLCILPGLSWFLFTVHASGEYPYEMSHAGEFAWMIDFASEGLMVVPLTLLRNIFVTVQLGVYQAAPALLSLTALLLVALWQGVPPRALFRQLGALPLSAGLVGLIFVVFWGMDGLLSWRLSYCIVPPLIVLTGAVAALLRGRIHRRIWHRVEGAATLGAVAIGTWIVLKPFAN